MKKVLGLVLVTLIIVSSIGIAEACNPYRSRCGPYNSAPVDNNDF